MRALFALLIFTFFAAPAAIAAGRIDYNAIDASRAGVSQRAQTEFISILWPSPETGQLQERTLNEDRAICDRSIKLVNMSYLLHRHGFLTETTIESWVKKVHIPPTCLMSVSSSQKKGSDYYILLTPAGDMVFNYRGRAFTPWYEINHAEAAFDTIVLDPWSITGIAPSGVVKENVGIQSDVRVQRYFIVKKTPSKLEQLFDSVRGERDYLVEQGRVPIPLPRPYN